MNTTAAKDLTFGIEIECTIPQNADVPRGGYHRGVQVPALPVGWCAQSDSSLHVTTEGHRAVEIVSPILRGEDGIEQVIKVIEWLKSIGAHVNASCGFHVHVGWTKGVSKELERLVALVARHESALYASSGTKTRERGRYCKPIREQDQFVDRFKEKTSSTNPSDRYVTLNLTNFTYGSRQTVEFRVFSGTLNVKKALGYIFLSLGLVEKALSGTREMTWDQNNTFKRSKGAGHNALLYLFKDLNWLHLGKRTFGRIDKDGAPEFLTVKQELLRLAKKYDGEG